jgi:hypothetical protein
MCHQLDTLTDHHLRMILFTYYILIVLFTHEILRMVTVVYWCRIYAIHRTRRDRVTLGSIGLYYFVVVWL